MQVHTCRKQMEIREGVEKKEKAGNGKEASSYLENGDGRDGCVLDRCELAQ
jgi:hypothetical protein